MTASGDEPQLSGQTADNSPSLSRFYSRDLADLVQRAEERLRYWARHGYEEVFFSWAMNLRDVTWMGDAAKSLLWVAGPEYHHYYLVGRPISTDDNVPVGTIYLFHRSNRWFVDRILIDEPPSRE